MTIKHRIHLIGPKIRWFFRDIKRMIIERGGFRKVVEVEERIKKLEQMRLGMIRKNSDESLKFAYGMEKQIEILKWVLGNSYGS